MVEESNLSVRCTLRQIDISRSTFIAKPVKLGLFCQRRWIWAGSDSYPNRSSTCFVRLECFKAIEHCEKLLSLWKDVDLGFAEVEEARKRKENILVAYNLMIEEQEEVLPHMITVSSFCYINFLPQQAF